MSTTIKLSQIEEDQALDPVLLHLLLGAASLKLRRV